MTNPNLALIAVVLDRSGSMETNQTDTVGSLNAFIADQRKQPGEARITLALFNEDYDLLYNDTPLGEVRDLTIGEYRPRGYTALNDAVGRTIDEIGARLALQSEDVRPGRVLVMILTDGHENHSRQYTLEAVRDKIAHQREKYGWDFVFLGADLTAQSVATGMGIDASKAMAYSATSGGMHVVLRSASAYASNARAAADISAVVFTAQDRLDNAPSAQQP